MKLLSGILFSLSGALLIGTIFVEGEALARLWHISAYSVLMAIYFRVDAL